MACRHDQVLHLIASKLKEFFKFDTSICVYADLQGWWSSESPQATIPSALVSTPFRPDIVVYNSATSSVAFLELTCPLDSEHHILSARTRKQSKPVYLQLLVEFDHLRISNYYETVEISVLGHYQLSSIQNITNFIQQYQSLDRSLIVQLELVWRALTGFSWPGTAVSGQPTASCN